MKSLALPAVQFISILALMVTTPFVSDANAEESEVSKLPSYAMLKEGKVRKEDIPDYEAILGFFNLVIDVENKSYGSGRSLLKESIGIDQVEADQVFNFIRSTIDETRRVARNASDSVCQRKAGLTSRAAIASEMRAIDRIVDTERSLRILDLPQVLGPEQEARLRAWVDEKIRPNMNIVTVDYDAFLETEDINVDNFVTRMCEAKPSIS